MGSNLFPPPEAVPDWTVSQDWLLDDPSPHRIGFDLERVMRTPYRIDDYQQNYFVIECFEDLLRQTRDADFGPLYARLRGAADIGVGELAPGDRILSRGTQRHAQADQNRFKDAT
jgi:phenylalanine-4-hydroxylase